MRELPGKSVAPFGKAGFAIVDFLSTANERNDNRPLGVAVHDG